MNLTPKVYKYSKLCMYDKPIRLCQPPCKSRTANSVLFEKEDNFCMTFMLAISWSAWGLAHNSCIKYKHIYICE